MVEEEREQDVADLASVPQEETAAPVEAGDGPSATAALEEELEKAKERELRLLADMENMRRRFAERELRLRREVTAEILRGLLPAVDNLERAVKAAPDEGPFATGVRMSFESLLEALGRQGATRFTPVGETFDPARHEALAEEAREGAQPGEILEVFVNGWLLHDEVIRPALVKVART